MISGDIHAFHIDDLSRVLAFIGEANVITDLQFGYHSGDFLHRLSNGLRGQDFDQYNFLYEVHGVLQGIIVVEQKYPAFDVFIHPQFRTIELETALIEWAEQLQLSRFPAKESEGHQQLMIDTRSNDKIRLTILSQRGYQIQAQPHMHGTIRDLSSTIPAVSLPEGFTIRGTNEADVEQLCNVHMSAFRSTWTPEAYLRVMRSPGFDPARELVVVASNGQFAAFLVYWCDPVSKTGLFEPVGCAQEFQRRGLTRMLMYEGMHRMVEAGMTRAMVNHEHEERNPASSGLYRAVGFTNRYSFFEGVKTLHA